MYEIRNPLRTYTCDEARNCYMWILYSFLIKFSPTIFKTNNTSNIVTWLILSRSYHLIFLFNVQFIQDDITDQFSQYYATRAFSNYRYFHLNFCSPLYLMQICRDIQISTHSGYPPWNLIATSYLTPIYCCLYPENGTFFSPTICRPKISAARQKWVTINRKIIKHLQRVW